MKTLEDLKSSGYDYLKKVTAVDYGTYLEAVYVVTDLGKGSDEVVRVNLPVGSPEVATVTGLYPAADWYERELAEMFGIRIRGRNAKRLLLEKWDGADPPLRKSFVWGKRDYKKVD